MRKFQIQEWRDNPGIKTVTGSGLIVKDLRDRGDHYLYPMAGVIDQLVESWDYEGIYLFGDDEFNLFFADLEPEGEMYVLACILTGGKIIFPQRFNSTFTSLPEAVKSKLHGDVIFKLVKVESDGE